MKKIKFFPEKTKIGGLLAGCALLSASCNSFLDIVPDNVPVIDHAFTNAMEAEKYLFTCYSYLPGSGEPSGNIGMTAGDEIWLNMPNHVAAPAWDYIAKGVRSADKSQPDFWKGSDYTYALFVGIRDCNTFLENIEDMSKVADLTADKRARWIAEAKFLKAYYHYYLLRMYGPIPIVDRNLPVSASPEEVQVKRQPFDDCVKYIVDLLDECNPDLPAVITNRQSELGRITKPINRAVKARVLLLAASPLFNGNSDLANFRDNDGLPLFASEEDSGKWAQAADAAREAIESAENAGHDLYYFDDAPFEISETTKTQLSVRQAVCDRWNDEVVWGRSGGRGRAGATLQNACMPMLDASMNINAVRGCMAPTLQVVEEFYTRNGVPIEEDKTLDFTEINELRTATADERYNFQEGYTTARINFDRENRFYADIGFDGGKWIMEYHPSRSDVDTYVLQAKVGQLGYGQVQGATSSTGYFTKKLVHWESGFGNTTAGVVEYAWPEIRLAEIYLMYAEALNEAEGPVADVHLYLNKVRSRAGLESVEASWRKYSTNPTKPDTKEGMREIIRRERLIELALEGHRYWDLLRWKLATDYFNQPITGWDVSQSDAEAYYQVKTIYNRTFVAPRDYFNPIPNSEMNVNGNLVQNPGW
ncbi:MULTISPECIES: RagB/SusD family nutrient uptake outer membrane protein [Alistipes]|jgi:ragB/susD domain protein|uniref:RagB/SusD family nutrient uptake outer membrane protein n=1 Tax=Alistipes TaxID=239759 RepID=UPI001B39E4A8|nr:MULTISPECIES: RagB/SusD family nutrient uptake outer membrane protein [Alistipes]MBQ4903992.1 RagB/SusD family nutrient uptake outer membrane protein [Alistipes sp. Marseille-P2263]MCI2258400.1 RagB/SusD family nutrient uptake outer membrane protein [Alistipes dispar]